MKILSFYKWIAGSMTDFINQFRNNEVLYNQARAYWNKLESSSSIILLIFIVIGIAMAFCYYQPYNNRPGRHYTPKHWLIFLAITFVLTFFVTWGFEYFAAKPVLDTTTMLQLKIALGNAIYASLLYFVVSVVWCFAFPTNAYRLFKF
jgi:membrane-associated HD superfamily phosphohydrolase